jgi:uncharacterized membrane protein
MLWRMQHLRRYFVAGLLVWLPILATYFILRLVVRLVNGIVAIIPANYHPLALFGQHVPGFGLIVTIVVVFLTGLLATNFIGHRLIHLWERILARIPLVRSIYSATKQVSHSILSPSSNSFSRAVLIQFPRPGLWSVGFQTNSNFTPLSNDENYTIFIPTSPNPTSGFMVIVSPDEIKPLDISIEEAFRMIISVGVVTPGSSASNTSPHKEVH